MASCEYLTGDLPIEAKFYLVRIVDLLYVRDHLNSYPLSYYSADSEGMGVSVDELKKATGLGILGSLRILKEMGFGYEAHKMINFDMDCHG